MKFDDRTAFRSAIIGPAMAFSAITISILLSPWFSWIDNALSDLGNYNNGIPAALVFNIGLIVSGVLLLIFSINFYNKQEDFILKIGSLILILTSIGLSSIGIFTENAGYLHYIVSVFFFISLLFTMLICGIGWILGGEKVIGIISLLLPIFPVWLWTLQWGGVAIPEMISAVAGFIWVLILLYSRYQNP